MNDDYILILLNEIKQSALYQNYMSTKKTSFQEDERFCSGNVYRIDCTKRKTYTNIWKTIRLTWIDDIPLVNTQILKTVETSF